MSDAFDPDDYANWVIDHSDDAHHSAWMALRHWALSRTHWTWEPDANPTGAWMFPWDLGMLAVAVDGLKLRAYRALDDNQVMLDGFEELTAWAEANEQDAIDNSGGDPELLSHVLDQELTNLLDEDARGDQ